MTDEYDPRPMIFRHGKKVVGIIFVLIIGTFLSFLTMNIYLYGTFLLIDLLVMPIFLYVYSIFWVYYDAK